jgi:hypothetical protein
MAARLEVEILLKRITKRCAEERIGAATIHDAWIICESDKYKFMRIYREEFEKLGLKPPDCSYDVLKPATLL